MHILMVSPHPVYTPRGTPISVLNRCKALSHLGHTVQLVTYPIGEDVVVPGLVYDRARVPGLRDVKVGPSAAKLPLDAAVLARAARRLVAGHRRFDVVHTHEEAGVLAIPLRRLLRIPHVYDMGNEFATVAANYGLPRVAVKAAGIVERAIVRHSDVVIAHFPAVAASASAADPAVPVEVVYNVPIEPRPDPALSARFRARWSAGGMPIAVYAGTLESYQGVDLLVGAAALLQQRGTACRIVIVGGRADQVELLRRDVASRGLGEVIAVEGLLPQEQITSVLDAADLLLSPRALGNNTPLKVFSYLHSSRPIVATRIESHTQVLDDDVAVLVEPTAEGIAGGIQRCVGDRSDSDRLARAAGVRARARFSEEAFVAGVQRAYDHLSVGHSSVVKFPRANRRAA